MEFANKTSFVVEHLPQPFLVDSTGPDIYQSSALVAPRLGDLARLRYVNGRVRGRIVLDGGATATVTVNIRADSTVLVSKEVGITGGVADFNIEGVVFAGSSGTSALNISVDVDTAASAATTATIAASVDVEHPIIFGA